MSRFTGFAATIILAFIVAACGNADLRHDIAARSIELSEQDTVSTYLDVDCYADMLSEFSDEDLEAVWEDEIEAEISDEGLAKGKGLGERLIQRCLDMDRYSQEVSALAGRDVVVELSCLQRTIPNFTELPAIRSTSDELWAAAYTCGANG